MNALGFIRGCGLVVWLTLSCFAQEQHLLRKFERRHITDRFYAEGAAFGDINRSGKQDVVAGPYWYEGPDFTTRHEIYPPKEFDIKAYSDNFFTFVYDIDGDDWPDVLVIGFPGEAAYWYRNPGDEARHWERFVAFPTVDNESPHFLDVTGDGQAELVFHTDGKLGFAPIPSEDPTQPWEFHAISAKLDYGRFQHGLGVGDVNGNGRQDILTKDGWWEHPTDLSVQEEWKFHPQSFGDAGGAQILVDDVNGDGRPDVITSLNAHGYGFSWYEQIEEAGKIRFKKHLIMGEQPEENSYGVAFSQLHALALVDIDGDGVKDVVTGKRYWAHGGKDPGAREPAVLYWFRVVRRNNSVEFVPHLIDSNSGIGTQVVVGDVSGNSLPDIVVSSKKGTFVHLQHLQEVDAEEWLDAQPRRVAEVPPAESVRNDEQTVDGIQPTSADGRVLNLDFEAGDLRDWNAEGDAFDGQPILGDTVRQRRGDMVSGHQGNRWVGTYEIGGDQPQGTLTSVVFPVKHPYASFFVGGGAHESTRVELSRADTDEVVFKACGYNTEQMRPVIVNLEDHVGKEIFIRVSDHHSDPWGHINFDHFRFHDAKPQLSPLEARILRLDEYPYSWQDAEEAASAMVVPEGFSVAVLAAEPDVVRPIAMAYDDRGRLWVAEAHEYPQRATEGQGKDRILIFADTNGDGQFDERKVFAEGLNLVSGLEVGFGGVWVGAAPYLMFIPDSDGDDVPDGDPQILLDGWGYQDTHETLNTFIWGPDGWLYGCHGVFTHSRVGKPGTPDRDRMPLNAAIWRYHPTRHEFQVFAHGTSNPWGVDFNDHGQAIATVCVIPHLFHVIQGARYHRQAGEHFNPHTYDDIKTIADHFHYSKDSSHSGNAKSNGAGGGHAHAGAMIYLGDSWPKQYRNQIFMNNIHGQRLNVDYLTRSGSGYVGSHGPDFLLTKDKASQILNLRYGPDGQVIFIDWYDMMACHHPDASLHDKEHGRIYKASYGETKSVLVDLQAMSDRELTEMCLHPNDWYVRHSRRILQERSARGELQSQVRERLRKIANSHADETRRLRAMWVLHVTGGLDEELLKAKFVDKHEYVRAWAIQLALDQEDIDPRRFLPNFLTIAREDSSQVVRLYLASALQQLPLADRWELLEVLTGFRVDADDHNLSLMYWYAAEPLAADDPQRALKLGLAAGASIPRIRDYMLRRIASLDSPAALDVLIGALAEANDDDQRLSILQGMRRSLQGRRSVAAPAGWEAAYKRLAQVDNQQIRTQATALGVTFGDQRALAIFRHLVESNEATTDQRREALRTLLARRDAQLAPTLQRMLEEPALRDLALTGLASFDHSQTAAAVLAAYREFSANEKRLAIATLSSRPAYALELLKAIAGDKIPKNDLSADIIRQLHNLQNSEIDTWIVEAWGQVRVTNEEKAALIEEYKRLLTSPEAAKADTSLGRAVFAKTCQQCHVLYGIGEDIGPDLTGSNRSDVDYLLSNILDPSALIVKEYQTTVIYSDAGRVLTGVVSEEDDQSVTLRSATETVVVPKDEIDERILSDVSMMPDNQLQQYSPEEIISLFAYLRGRSQVPMLATSENAGQLFNGLDLAGWQGNEELWSVEEGEIVGRSPGIEQNEFLIRDLAAEDFRLTLEVKLVGDEGNSGIQFRSRPLNGTNQMFGYQADIGPGWWGKLYEEHGRELLWEKSGEQHVKKGEWNEYVIETAGHRVRTWINDQLCVDLEDPAGDLRGVFGLQIHSGGPMEVRFRNLQFEVLRLKPR